MPSYDFKSLSPIDFEFVVRDLLQEDLGVRLESFKVGKDKGIDLRYSDISGESWIIQCKHYAESGFDVLFTHLKTKELAKVKALKPERYLLATSVGLTPHQKEALWKLFHPYIQRPQDVYGREDLNNLLGRFPEVEKRNFKL